MEDKAKKLGIIAGEEVSPQFDSPLPNRRTRLFRYCH